MKYCFTTLAIGEEYEQNALRLFNSLKDKTTNCDFFLTTDNDSYKDFEDDRIRVNIIKPYTLHDSRGGFSFNLNLKCMALKHVLAFEKENKQKDENYKPHDFVFYIDGDWSLMDGFNESKIMNIFNYMINESKDFIFERPALV